MDGPGRPTTSKGQEMILAESVGYNIGSGLAAAFCILVGAGVAVWWIRNNW